jgi:hypothetical protein
MEGILKMSETSRKSYEAQLERQRIRDKLELGVDESDSFAGVFAELTNMEKIVFIHLEYGLTPKFTYEHLGISRQRYSEILGNIRKKITKEDKRNDL